MNSKARINPHKSVIRSPKEPPGIRVPLQKCFAPGISPICSSNTVARTVAATTVRPSHNIPTFDSPPFAECCPPALDRSEEDDLDMVCRKTSGDAIDSPKNYAVVDPDTDTPSAVAKPPYVRKDVP